jgi:hypothetical protein
VSADEAADRSPAAPAAARPTTAAPPGGRGWRARDLWIAALVFGAAFVLYRATPSPNLLDSKYALLTSESLLREGSWDLSRYLPALTKPRGEAAPRRRPVDSRYQLREVEGRLLYVYPPGTPLLTAPLFALYLPFGGSVLDDGEYSRPRERRSQALLAALVTSLAVAWIYRLARYEVGSVAALFVAVLAAAGTTLWTVASRSLWSHTWSVLLGAATVGELLRWESGRRRRPELLGLLLVASFWVRPTNAIVAGAVAFYVFAAHRPAVWRLLATGAAGAAGYLAFSAQVWGAALPAYVARGASFDNVDFMFVRSLARQLLDPGIGWLVYSPIVLAIAGAFWRRGVPADRRRLAALAAAIVAIHVLFYNVRVRGFGLGAPGPRLFTDLVPWLAWLGALALRAGRGAASAERPHRGFVPRWAVACLVGLLAIASIAAHAEGAIRGRVGSFGFRGDPDASKLAGAHTTIVDYLRVLPQVRLWRQLRRGVD